MDKLRDWLVKFNNRHYQDSLARYGWSTGKYDYSLSTEDNSPYEENFPNEKEPVFPHLSNSKEMGEGFEMTPLANTYLCSMIRSCIEGENIGGTGNTDFLAISFSSPDILGHKFGINGIEMQDMFLSLDKDISLLLLYLDKKYGENGYLLFLTADHGGSHNANYLKDKKVPAGVFPKTVVPELNSYLKGVYGVDSIVATFTNYYQFYFNNKAFSNGLSRESVRSTVVDWLQKRPEVLYAYDLNKISSSNLPEKIKQMAINGYYYKRGGDVQALLNTAWYEYAGKEKGNTHGTFSPADTHIPLIFYGWNVKQGETTVEYHTTDIAPTISSMLHIQMPNGSIGSPVQFK
jgi:predicted AlkP superfamily pyrophosphatase or phosphodiesterase